MNGRSGKEAWLRGATDEVTRLGDGMAWLEADGLEIISRWKHKKDKAYRTRCKLETPSVGSSAAISGHVATPPGVFSNLKFSSYRFSRMLILLNLIKRPMPQVPTVVQTDHPCPASLANTPRTVRTTIFCTSAKLLSQRTSSTSLLCSSWSGSSSASIWDWTMALFM